MHRVALMLLLLPITAPVAAAGFDCAKAGTRVEKIVCTDAALGALDERLGKAFAGIEPEGPGTEWGRRAPRVDDQRRWLREVRDRCPDAACLKTAYTERIAALEKWHRTAPIDGAIAGQYVFDHTVALISSEDLPTIDASDCLSLVPRADGDFDLAIDTVQTNGHMCWFTGRLQRDGDFLRLVRGSQYDGEYTDPEDLACDLRIRVEHGEIAVIDPDSACRRYCGARAGLDGLHFPRGARKPGQAVSCADPND